MKYVYKEREFHGKNNIAALSCPEVGNDVASGQGCIKSVQLQWVMGVMGCNGVETKRCPQQNKEPAALRVVLAGSL